MYGNKEDEWPSKRFLALQANQNSIQRPALAPTSSYNAVTPDIRARTEIRRAFIARYKSVSAACLPREDRQQGTADELRPGEPGEVEVFLPEAAWGFQDWRRRQGMELESLVVTAGDDWRWHWHWHSQEEEEKEEEDPFHYFAAVIQLQHWVNILQNGVLLHVCRLSMWRAGSGDSFRRGP